MDLYPKTKPQKSCSTSKDFSSRKTTPSRMAPRSQKAKIKLVKEEKTRRRIWLKRSRIRRGKTITLVPPFSSTPTRRPACLKDSLST